MRKEFLKMQQAADYLGVNRKTLDNWIRANRKITYTQDPITGFRYFEKKDLDSFMEGWKVNAK